MGITKYKEYYKDGLYHIYNRGNFKQKIFLDEADFRFYLSRLKKYTKKHNVDIVAYALMPNHIHLIAHQKTENPVFKFISSLHTSYSMYFNWKYRRVGHLFQGRFQQRIISKIEDLAYLTCYIHLNPVHAKLSEKIDDYHWTSFAEYAGKITLGICNLHLIEGYFNSQGQSLSRAYIEFLRGVERNIEVNKLLKKLNEAR